MKCNKLMSDHTGFYFRPCGRQAKWIVYGPGCPPVPRCGIHAKLSNMREGITRRPITKDDEQRGGE